LGVCTKERGRTRGERAKLLRVEREEEETEGESRERKERRAEMGEKNKQKESPRRRDLIVRENLPGGMLTLRVLDWRLAAASPPHPSFS
jgi:hypothetical protein